MEQEHHGKLMFIVLGLIGVLVIVLGLVAVFGRNTVPAPAPVVDSTPEDERQKYIDATTAPGSSSIDDPEVQRYNDATSAPGNTNGGGNSAERERYIEATSAI